MIILHETDVSIKKEDSERAFSLEGIMQDGERVTSRICLDSKVKPAWVRYLNDKEKGITPYHGPVFYVVLSTPAKGFGFRHLQSYEKALVLDKSNREDFLYFFDHGKIDGKTIMPNSFVLLEPGQEHEIKLDKPNKEGSQIYGSTPSGILAVRFGDNINREGMEFFDFGTEEKEIMWPMQKINTRSKAHIHRERREYFYCIAGSFFYHTYNENLERNSSLLLSENGQRTVHVPSNVIHNHEAYGGPAWFMALNVPINFRDNQRFE